MKRLLGVFIASLAIIGVTATLNRTNAADKAAPTFARDVASIIFNKCATCHRPGEAVPMSLMSYQEVRPWAKAAKEQIIERTMPPWYADPASSLKFRNDRRLSQKEIETIVAWVDAGSPKGDDADLPALPEFAKGWSWGEPDLIIPMPVEFEVPAEGELPMQNFYMAVPFKVGRGGRAAAGQLRSRPSLDCKRDLTPRTQDKPADCAKAQRSSRPRIRSLAPAHSS